MNFLVHMLAGFLILPGTIFILQGMNLLPGSFMTGRIEWAIYGTAMVVAGSGLLVWWRGRR